MKLTKKEDYTFLLISSLVKNYKIRSISLNKIADEYKISSFFLKQIVRPLIKERLINSKEGINGGYSLIVDPKQTSLFKIFKAIDALPTLTDCCMVPNKKCENENSCKPKKIWNDLNILIIDNLKNYYFSA